MTDSKNKEQINPLYRLVIERKYAIEEILYEMLKDLVKFEKGTRSIIFQEPFYRCLDSDAKIVVTLAAIYALYKLGWRDNPNIGLKELSQITGLNYNTVRPRLSKAGKAYKYSEKVDQGIYKISESKLYEAKQYILDVLSKCMEGR